MYAIAFTFGLFVIPCLLVGGGAWALDRPGITDRGITSTVCATFLALMGFVTLWAWVLPTPVGI